MLKFRFKPFNFRWLKKRSADTPEKTEMSVSRIKRSSSCPKLDPSLTRVTVVKGSEDYTAEGTTIKVVCAEGFRLSSSRSRRPRTSPGSHLLVTVAHVEVVKQLDDVLSREAQPGRQKLPLNNSSGKKFGLDKIFWPQKAIKFRLLT